ncbi:MAG: hypothetical protein [Caudoviricetes sp.]|nr:MAG: hypothetical protein [Caudoviricetes sp.]
MNLEKFTEQDEILSETIKESSLQGKIADEMIAIGHKRLQKQLKRNKREIERLGLLAKEALINNNKDSYLYAIGKVRKLVGKPVSDDIMDSLWVTSRERVVQMIQEAQILVGE